MLKYGLCGIVQAAWLGSCFAESIRFKKAARTPVAKTQARVLAEIIKNAKNSLFAAKHDFSRIKSVDDFCRQVPLSDYEDYQPLIEKIAAGQTGILTDEPVSMFELTSGSTSATKMIPYTESLQQAFNRALHPWLLDLYTNFAGLWGGPSYWVITPKASSEKTTSGGIKIGFAADSEYFGSWGKHLVDLLMAVPAEVGRIKEINEWKHATLVNLLACEDLRLISLWNPSFLTALFSELSADSQALMHDLKIKAGTRRSEKFSAALAQLQQGNAAEFTRIMWPKLALISSWTEAEAAPEANRVKTMFAHSQLQSKGILATESPVTIPLCAAKAPVLAVRSAFFEFIDSESGQIFQAHQLQLNRTYSLVITTFAGLYRYRLHDLVKVVDFYQQLPCLAFIGKEAIVSDLCGEKLNAGHIKQIFASEIPEATSAFIAPERGDGATVAGYILFLSARHSGENLAARIEARLRENFHYNWCIDNGQLQPLKLLSVPGDEQQLQILRLKRLAQLGGQFSTAKTGVLSRQDGWSAWFSEQLARDR